MGDVGAPGPEGAPPRLRLARLASSRKFAYVLSILALLLGSILLLAGVFLFVASLGFTPYAEVYLLSSFPILIFGAVFLGLAEWTWRLGAGAPSYVRRTDPRPLRVSVGIPLVLLVLAVILLSLANAGGVAFWVTVLGLLFLLSWSIWVTGDNAKAPLYRARGPRPLSLVPATTVLVATGAATGVVTLLYFAAIASVIVPPCGYGGYAYSTVFMSEESNTTCGSSTEGRLQVDVVVIGGADSTITTADFGLSVNTPRGASVPVGTAGPGNGNCTVDLASSPASAWVAVLVAPGGASPVATFDSRGWTAWSGGQLPVTISGGQTLQLVSAASLSEDELSISTPSGCGIVGGVTL